MEFEHVSLPQRVLFATGGARGNLAGQIETLGARRVMVIAGEGERDLARTVADGLPVVRWHHEVVMHVPVEVAERAREIAAADGVDALVCIGGGSTTGLAKAVALTSGLPIVAVPTTYAGSEATNVWGMTEGARKTTGVDDKVLPRAIVYDASLMLTLPVELSVASGLNALAHCVDSMWAPRADPIDRALAAEGIRALRIGLPLVVKEPTGAEGREHALYGAYLSARAFASAGSGLHHKICHVLGGMFNLPHAQTHAVVLPYVLAFNAPYADDARRLIAAAFDVSAEPGSASDPDGAVTGLNNLRAQLNAPRSLRDLGMPEDGIAAAAEAVLAAVPPRNPRPVTRENITELLHAAWSGTEGTDAR
ncbi:maleylacetate reductase [Actinospica acidithermotolerans]|uniref:maleylacetate reductase n=1 Tax=Actinospica acidithermotolerans TaxID=2828514 RepID=UPI003557DCED